MTWLFIATRIITNPLSNLFRKRLAHASADPVFIIAATHASLTLACLPGQNLSKQMAGSMLMVAGAVMIATVTTEARVTFAGGRSSSNRHCSR